MKYLQILLGTITISMLFITSCKKKEEVAPIPTTYDFKNASNISTIDFSGQKTRLEMLDQISSLMGGATPVTEEILLEMFDGKNFTDPTLTNSGKKLSDKTAASVDYFSGYSLEKTEISN